MIKSVFVYGTLRPGGRYNYLTRGLSLESISPAYVDGFDLYGLKPQNYPGIVPGKGRVYGDLLEFENVKKALQVLDELEGVANTPPHYFREKVFVEPMQMDAWAYIFNLDAFTEMTSLVPIKSGDWKSAT